MFECDKKLNSILGYFIKFEAEQKAFFGRNIVHMHLGGGGQGVSVCSLQQSEKKWAYFYLTLKAEAAVSKVNNYGDSVTGLFCYHAHTQIHSSVCIHVHICFSVYHYFKIVLRCEYTSN